MELEKRIEQAKKHMKKGMDLTMNDVTGTNKNLTREVINQGLKRYDEAYNLIKEELEEIAEKKLMRTDILLFNIAGLYTAIADLKYPQIYDKANIVPAGTKEREYMEKANEWLDKLIKLYPKDWIAQYCIGTNFCRMENYTTAIKHLTKAREINPEDSNIIKNIAYAKRKIEYQNEPPNNNTFLNRNIPREHLGWC